MIVHCQKEYYDIYIGRPSNLSSYEHYGNPFSHINDSNAIVKVSNRNEAINRYENWLRGVSDIDINPEQRNWIVKNIPKLKDKILGCWCRPKSCHGDVLEKLLKEGEFKEIF